MDVPVREHLRRRPRKSVTDRFGHRIRVPEWPSSVGMAKVRRHYKKIHPRAFRKSIKKGVATRAQNLFWKKLDAIPALARKVKRKVGA